MLTWRALMGVRACMVSAGGALTAAVSQVGSREHRAHPGAVTAGLTGGAALRAAAQRARRRRHAAAGCPRAEHAALLSFRLPSTRCHWNETSLGLCVSGRDRLCGSCLPCSHEGHGSTSWGRPSAAPLNPSGTSTSAVHTAAHTNGFTASSLGPKGAQARLGCAVGCPPTTATVAAAAPARLAPSPVGACSPRAMPADTTHCDQTSFCAIGAGCGLPHRDSPPLPHVSPSGVCAPLAATAAL